MRLSSNPGRSFIELAGSSALALVALFYVACAVVGAVRWYSPVPLGDMWDGYIQWYCDLAVGKWDAWYGGAGEHRVIFTRLFFFLDLRYLGGLSISLIAVNLILMALVWAELTFAASILLRDTRRRFFIVSALLLVMCFSWLQNDNITWGNQSQFFAAYLFPLGAFLCLAISLKSSRRRSWFALSATLGVVSAGTMGNGVLALPVVIAMVLLSKRHVRARLVVLVPLAVAVIYLYLHGLTPGPNPNPGWNHVLAFGLGFLGAAPALALRSHEMAIPAGIAFLVASIGLFIAWHRSADREPVTLALLAFVGYVVIAAGVAAVARAKLGFDSALSSRYVTATLLGWSALLILFVARFRETAEARGALLVLAVFVPFGLLPAELEVFRDDGPAQVRQRWIAALGLDLHIRDGELSRILYPDDAIYHEADEAIARNLSVFGMPDMIRARRCIGAPADTLGLIECAGSVDAITPVPGSPGIPGTVGASRIFGWAVDEREHRVPSLVLVCDERRVVIGAAFTGADRRDVAERFASLSETCGFHGYVRSATDGPTRLFCFQ